MYKLLGMRHSKVYYGFDGATALVSAMLVFYLVCPACRQDGIVYPILPGGELDIVPCLLPVLLDKKRPLDRMDEDVLREVLDLLGAQHMENVVWESDFILSPACFLSSLTKSVPWIPRSSTIRFWRLIPV